MVANFRSCGNANTFAFASGVKFTPTATTATLKGLRPNAQYVIFVQTVDGAGAASEPSETVVAWTDPIVPAYAEPPAIQPR